MNLNDINELHDIQIWRDLTEPDIIRVAKRVELIYDRRLVLEDIKKFDRQFIVYFQHVSSGILFNLIPGGQFQMGLNIHDEQHLLAIARQSNEFEEFEEDLRLSFSCWRPLHEQLVKPFLMSRTPLTQSNCKQLGFTPNRNRLKRIGNAAYLQKMEIDKICELHGFSIPTETQWEYAARGGRQVLFYYGNTFDIDADLDKLCVVNFSNSHDLDCYANGFGLVGIGSTSEICADNYQDDYSNILSAEQAYSDGSDVFARRGGAAEMWPWQYDMEWIYGTVIFRSSTEVLPSSACTARLIISE